MGYGHITYRKGKHYSPLTTEHLPLANCQLPIATDQLPFVISCAVVVAEAAPPDGLVGAEAGSNNDEV